MPIRGFCWRTSGDKNMQRSNKDIILLSVLACLWAVQAAVILAEILGHWHAPLIDQRVYYCRKPQARMAPKWDMFIYVVFIAVALISGKISFSILSKAPPSLAFSF